MVVPVILCGGSGSRLWPLSRSTYPKQLLPLVSSQTMLQDTVLRAASIPDMLPPIVICNEQHRFLVAEQLHTIQQENATLILEPIAKNTAPAITMAVLHVLSTQQDPLLLVLPADHVIQNMTEFQIAVEQAVQLAERDLLVTFGIQPTHPETGYGYINVGEEITGSSGYRVKQFVEKPDIETAQHYLDSGNYYWNSGMFLFRASIFLREMQQHSPDIVHACQKACSHMTRDLDFYRIPKTEFSDCRNESIDYAVMEKSKSIAVVKLNAGWSDVGSWDALWSIKSSNGASNVVHGDVYLDHVENSYVHAENRIVAVVGVKDHIIVETADAVLVAHKDECQQVKNIVNQLKINKRSEIDLHRRVYRPWGYYEVLDGTNAFQVKRIMVKPGASLSLQAHHHRSEHWVVISGIATVTRDQEKIELYANQSTYIPIGAKHRLENRQQDPLIIIEVQCGDYIGEDDIVRFEDVYGREGAVEVL